MRAPGCPRVVRNWSSSGTNHTLTPPETEMNTYPNFRKIRETRVAAAVAAALLLAGASLPVSAGTATAGGSPRASRPESAGVASGFAVGAAAGGPIGALVGAAAGGWLGDRMHREKAAHALTRDELAAAQLRGRGLSMNLMFRTDEATLRPDDEALVARFAALAATTPGAVVHVTGFADPRGTAAYNAALAAARAAAVAAKLVAAGMPAQRLVVSADTGDAGMQVAAEPEEVLAVAASAPDLDGFAFQRRVSLVIAPAPHGDSRVAKGR